MKRNDEPLDLLSLHLIKMSTTTISTNNNNQYIFFLIIWQKNCVYISDKKMKLRLFSVAITSCYFVINHEWSTIQCQTALRTIIYCLLCIIRSLIFHNDEIQQSIPQSQSEPGLANQQVRPDQLDPRLFYPCWSCGAVELWSWGAAAFLPPASQPATCLWWGNLSRGELWVVRNTQTTFQTRVETTYKDKISKYFLQSQYYSFSVQNISNIIFGFSLAWKK